MVHGEEKRLPYFVHKPLSTFHIRWRTEKKYKCFIRIFRITSLGGRYVAMSKMWTSIKIAKLKRQKDAPKKITIVSAVF